MYIYTMISNRGLVCSAKNKGVWLDIKTHDSESRGQEEAGRT